MRTATQWDKKTEKNHTKGRKNSFVLPVFSHPFRPALLTTVRTPQLGRVLTGEGRVEGTTSLPSFLGHHTKDPLQFYPTQRPATLRPMEVAKNKEEGQGLSVAATLQEQPWLPVTCSAEDPSSFHPCRNEQPAHPRGPLQISFSFFAPVPDA